MQENDGLHKTVKDLILRGSKSRKDSLELHKAHEKLSLTNINRGINYT